ncbi:UNVERIFIED_CONTAM: hypothetical protein FKN15_014878 [Acipenser sinensis]
MSRPSAGCEMYAQEEEPPEDNPDCEIEARVFTHNTYGQSENDAQSPCNAVMVEPAMGHTAAIPTVSQVEPAMGHTAAIPTVSQVEPAMGHTAAIPTVSQVEPAMGHTAAIPTVSQVEPAMGHTAAIPTVSQVEPAMGHTAAIPTVSQVEPAMGHTAAIPTVSQVEPAMGHTAAIPTVSQVEPAMGHPAAIPTVSLQRCCWGTGISLLTDCKGMCPNPILLSVSEGHPQAVLTLQPAWSQIFTGESVTLSCEVEGDSADWRFKQHRDGREDSDQWVILQTPQS